MRFHSHGAGRFVRSVAVLCILCAQLPAQAADLPIRHIVLYKHGLAYIERGGTLQPGEEARLDFRSSDMNDILKSLTVSTGGGLRVTDIRYDSNETIDQKLGRFPFQLGNDQLLSAFLDSLKGAKIEVKTDHLLTGTIVGARALNSVTANGSANVREQMTVLLASGELVNADLGSVVSLRLLDTKLESQLRQYLEVRAANGPSTDSDLYR